MSSKKAHCIGSKRLLKSEQDQAFHEQARTLVQTYYKEKERKEIEGTQSIASITLVHPVRKKSRSSEVRFEINECPRYSVIYLLALSAEDTRVDR